MPEPVQLPQTRMALAKSGASSRAHIVACPGVGELLEQKGNNARASMIGPYEIDYIEFPSTDAGQTRKFFGDAFGWTFQTYSPSYHEIHGAGLLGGIEGGARKTAGPTAGIRTTDLEAARQAVVAAGGVITLPLFEYPGGRRFHFREPGGSELLVYQVVE